MQKKILEDIKELMWWKRVAILSQVNTSYCNEIKIKSEEILLKEKCVGGRTEKRSTKIKGY